MRIRTLRSRTIAVGVTAALGIGLLSGCASSTGPGKPDREITVWSQENLPDRVAATQKVIDGFEKKTGVKVKLVGVDEKQMPQLIMSAAALGHPARRHRRRPHGPGLADVQQRPAEHRHPQADRGRSGA
ncbi:ABC-type glycerol-3-phosphate transport system substrate-binding protein [Streptomyces ambofaciens]